MKKILSFLLAVSLVLGLSAAGFAADGEGQAATGLSDTSGATLLGNTVATNSGATLQDKAEGALLKPRVSINDTQMLDTIYRLKSPKKPVSAEHFVEGRKMVAYIRSTEQIGTDYQTQLVVGGYRSLGITATDLGKIFEGEVKVYWEDGSYSSWQVELSVSGTPEISDYIVDEQGNTVNRYRLEIGKTYTLKVKLKDLGSQLHKDGHKKMTGEWKMNDGAERIKLLGGPGESLKNGDKWMDAAAYAISENGGELDLPFEMKFIPVATGYFAAGFSSHLDDSSNPSYGRGWSYKVIDTIEDGSDLINMATDVTDNGSEIVVNVDTNKKISAGQFERLREMAQQSGNPVSLKLRNTPGIQMKLDIPSTLPQGFLDDLAAKNNGKFDPSVNLNIPNGANRYVSAHGQWVDFMYSGRLPGKMTVTVDIPKGTFQDNVNELTAWWYDETTHRASKQGVTVSFDKAAGTATFVIDHCSAWGLFPVGYDPNLEQKPDTKPDSGSSDNDSSDSDSFSDSSEADFSWYAMRERVKSAKAGSRVRMSVPAGEKIPASLLRALAEKEDVTLVLRQNGKSLKILSGAVGELEQKEYRFSELQALFSAEKTASGSESDAEDADKTNPGTGASGHMGAALLLSACGLLIVRRMRG